MSYIDRVSASITRLIRNPEAAVQRFEKYARFVSEDYFKIIGGIFENTQQERKTADDNYLTRCSKYITNVFKRPFRDAVVEGMVKAGITALLVASVVAVFWGMISGPGVGMLMGSLTFPVAAFAIHSYSYFKKAEALY